jgi:hypothetical protein
MTMVGATVGMENAEVPRGTENKGGNDMKLLVTNKAERTWLRCGTTRVTAVLALLVALTFTGPFTQPASAEVNGVNGWLISGATGSEDFGASVTDNQFLFAMSPTDNSGSDTALFSGPTSSYTTFSATKPSYGYTVTGGGTTVASETFDGGANGYLISCPNALVSPKRYCYGTAVNNLTAGTTYTVTVWVVDRGVRDKDCGTRTRCTNRGSRIRW